ncbi:hypothetical protein [Kitasatospora sp. NPDC059673]|uniref:hypothetical protein n=1 Tax=Kitasatospora sp. NPDC059673 TaxID=3346901 RepID=UPI0036B8579B
MLPYLITLAVLAGVLTLLGLAGQALRRHRGAAAAAGGMLAAYEEAVRGTSHAAHAELLAEANRTMPIEVPGGRFEGRSLLADRAARPARGRWRTVRAWWRRG